MASPSHRCCAKSSSSSRRALASAQLAPALVRVVHEWSRQIQNALADDEQCKLDLRKLEHLQFGQKRLRVDWDYKMFAIDDQAREEGAQRLPSGEIAGRHQC